MARKVSKIIVRGQHIEIETECPDCPNNKVTKVVKPENETDKKIVDDMKSRYPWAQVIIDKKK